MKIQAKFFLMSTAFLMTIAANAVAGGGEPCANGGQGGQGGQGCTVVSQREVQVEGRVVTEYVLRSDAGELVTRYEYNERRIDHLTNRQKRQLRKAQKHLDKADVLAARAEPYRAENSRIASNLGGRAVTHVVPGSVTTTASSSTSVAVAVDHSNDQFSRPAGGCPSGYAD